MIKIISKSLKMLSKEGKKIGKCEDGQVIVFTALAGLALALMVATIFNIGVVIGEKMKVQDAADAAAYSQAVWEARVLNFIAYTNRAIISHMVTIAFCTAVFSQEEMWQRIEQAAYECQLHGLAEVASVIHSIWSVAKDVAGPVRTAALAWCYACLSYQNTVIIELAIKVSQGAIARGIANEIDPAININSGAYSFLNLVNLKNLVNIIMLHTFLHDFDSIKEVYRESCDGFSNGTSLPRSFKLSFPPGVSVIKFGLKGDLRIDRLEIGQSDEIYADIGVEDDWGIISIWKNLYSYKLAEQTYEYLTLGIFPFVNYQYPSSSQKKFPSVFVQARKPRSEISQIPLFGTENSFDIQAFARAQVFYYDPDEQRSQKLQHFNPPRQPNLFNPFWHARLAPLDPVGSNEDRRGARYVRTSLVARNPIFYRLPVTH